MKTKQPNLSQISQNPSSLNPINIQTEASLEDDMGGKGYKSETYPKGTDVSNIMKTDVEMMSNRSGS